MGSDHAPLLLTGDVARQNYSGCRFETFWVNMPRFYETVQSAWSQPVNTQDNILRMHVKLIRTAKALKLRRRQSLGNLPLRLEIAKQLLLVMDAEQEQRILTQDDLFSTLPQSKISKPRNNHPISGASTLSTHLA
jgi:hypothetical protein